MEEQQEVLEEIYNLILNSGTREWERRQLITTKNAIENGGKLREQLNKLEAKLCPLAVRNNLTPDLSDFYASITNDAVSDSKFDFSKHVINDLVHQERAIFAGGCFWCMVEPFETKPGVISILSGYTGGEMAQPTYDQVSSGYTGHVEAVEIIFDNRLINYEDLLTLYWQLTDPTDAFGQFQDRGSQYQPIIFVENQDQKQIAEASKQNLINSGKYKQPIVTEIKEAGTFWPAENYHQEFYKKRPKRYKRIKRSRQQFLSYQQLKSQIRFGLSKYKRT